MATGQGLAVATYLAVLTTALAYLLYARGLRTTAVTTATTLGLAEPAVAAALGLTVLGERLTITGLAGLGVLAVGLVIAAWPARRPTAAATSDRALGQPQKGATPSGRHIDAEQRMRTAVAVVPPSSPLSPLVGPPSRAHSRPRAGEDRRPVAAGVVAGRAQGERLAVASD